MVWIGSGFEVDELDLLILVGEDENEKGWRQGTYIWTESTSLLFTCERRRNSVLVPLVRDLVYDRTTFTELFRRRRKNGNASDLTDAEREEVGKNSTRSLNLHDFTSG